MARIESISIGGFYPTPKAVIPLLGSLFEVEPSTDYDYFDPCAGDGEAVISFIKAVHGVSDSPLEGTCNLLPKVDLCTIEMEATRYEALEKTCKGISWNWGKWALYGDAFRVAFKEIRGVGLLYLNPPYDIDPLCGRLEEKFLARFTPTLKAGGYLVFLVPFYALAASAVTLGKEYDKLSCYRFPEPEFSGFKQVVLIARKREMALFEPDPKVVAKVQGWAKDSASIKVLKAGVETFKIPKGGYGNPFEWKVTPVDFTQLLSVTQPWGVTDRGGKAHRIQGLLPEGTLEDLLVRRYPVAMPPRSAHIAAGIAAGIFNGSRITPDKATSKLPPILVKGVFDKEFRTIEEKKDKEGNVKGLLQVQEPKLVTTVLDLQTNTFVTIRPLADITGVQEIAGMTMADLLAEYGQGLMRVMLQQCPVLHDPARPEDHIPLAPLARKLFPAQDQATQAAIKLLGGLNASKQARQFKSAFVLGEIGSGKCLGLGTPVLKFDGTIVPVEEVRIGDLLMGPDSTPRQVLGTTRDRGPLFKIIPTVGNSWVCNDAHILTLIHTQTDDIFDIPLKEFVESRRVRRTLSKAYTWPKKNKVTQRTSHARSEFKQFFPAEGVDFPQGGEAPLVDPYFLGVWYGDGTKELNSVSVTTKDPEILEMLREGASSYGLTVRASKNPKRCPTYTLTQGSVGGRRNLLLDQIRMLFGDGSSLPQSYLTGDRETRSAFLAGLLDSDGHLSRGRVFDFIQKNKRWAEGVCFLATSLGIRSTMAPARKSAYRGVPGDIYWRVCLSGDFSKIPLRIKRKQAPPRAVVRRNKASDSGSGVRRTRHVNRTAFRVEPLGDGEYAGFELDGDGRFLLGDLTVTHNTTVALAAMETIKAKRTLVLCPPHLLQSWTDQNEAVTPWVRAIVLSDIQDVQKLVNDTDDRPVLAILSRETAKLGHSYSSVSGLCAACGSVLEHGTDFAKKRETCSARKLLPKDATGEAMLKLALSLVQVFPESNRVCQLLRTRPLQGLIQRLRAKGDDDDAPRVFNQAAWLKALAGFDALIDVLLQDTRETAWPAVLALLAAHPEPSRVLRVVRAVIEQGHLDRARQALLFVDDTHEVLALITQMKAIEKESSRSYFSETTWKSWGEKRTFYRSKLGEKVYDWQTQDFDLNDEKLRTWKGHVIGEPGVALEAISLLGNEIYRWSPECGEPLFQAVPEPRRYPLATFIARRYPKFFDLLILDECHEYATDGSAQERSAHRLTALGMPTLGLTGTIMNGYAESMFTNMWSFSADFRREFDRDERSRFVDRYGYRKRLVEDHDKKTGEVLEYGSVTDRVEKTERTVGHAPGVLPLFLLRYMLPQAVTLHKTDLGIDIPNCSEQVETVIPNEELLTRYRSLERAVMDQIRKDRFTDLAGKLWGAMADLPSYFDLATEDTGNRDGGHYSIRYPESVGGGLIAQADPFPLNTILPKEALMLDHVQTALDEGRNVMVFGWHTTLLPRLSRLLEKRLKTKCPILDPSKVPTKKRQAWIDEMVVRKKRRVLVVNPVAIQTGLNNLVYFSDEFWMENPACNPTIYRQAVGRVDRIGQELMTRIFFLLYEGTSQQALHSLLMQKVAVSMSTDGLDAESALQAAGIGVGSGFSSFAVGRQLYEMLLSGQNMGKIAVPKKKAPALIKVPRALSEEEAFQYAMQLGE